MSINRVCGFCKEFCKKALNFNWASASSFTTYCSTRSFVRCSFSKPSSNKTPKKKNSVCQLSEMNLPYSSFLPNDTNQHLNARGGRGFADMSLLKEAHISGNLFSQRSPSQGFGCWNLQWSKHERAISGPP